MSVPDTPVESDFGTTAAANDGNGPAILSCDEIKDKDVVRNQRARLLRTDWQIKG